MRSGLRRSTPATPWGSFDVSREIIVTEPRGAPRHERFLIAQCVGRSLRIARSGHEDIAHEIAAEWAKADYSKSPGFVNRLNFKEVP